MEKWEADGKQIGTTMRAGQAGNITVLSRGRGIYIYIFKHMRNVSL